MKEQTRAYMQQYHMTVPGDGIVIGLSGGADSVCLLHLLCCLKEEMGYKLRAVHVNHGLRGAEADRDEVFAEQLCRQLEVPCRKVRLNVAEEAAERGISVEEAGREARYRILEEEAERWEQEDSFSLTDGKHVWIAVAHHANDNAETILHHLFRGSGLKGLGGIAPVRGRILRPLLWAERTRILAYLQQEKLSWVEDSTNGANEYTRNRIRNEILPMVTEAVNPQAVQNILRAGEWMRQADRYLEQEADGWLSEYGTKDEGCCRLEKDALNKQPDLLKGYIIRRSLEKLGASLKDITSGHIEDAAALAAKGTGKQLMLPHGIRVWTEYGVLCLGVEKEQTVPADFGDAPEKNIKQRVFFCENAGGFPKNQYTKWFDYDKIKDTLSVRTRRPGDYITLPGGGRKTVKSYMIDEKIPRAQRDRILLLAEGSHVLWIIGRRISEYYKVTEHTKKVLEVQYDGGKQDGR